MILSQDAPANAQNHGAVSLDEDPECCLRAFLVQKKLSQKLAVRIAAQHPTVKEGVNLMLRDSGNSHR